MNEKYALWRRCANDAEVAAELLKMENDEPEIESRFSSELHFGTAGMRSRLGAGTNRMNVYTVSRATQGLSAYVLQRGGRQQGMVVAYDTRKNSQRFAERTALVFAANGIRAYLFEQATGVPELSFAIRELGAYGGVAITASHNPKDYNGYKVYAPWGGQLLDEESGQIMRHIEQTASFEDVRVAEKAEALRSGLLVMLGADMDEKYFGRLLLLAKQPELIEQYAGGIKAVYTPLFGTGLRTFAGTAQRLPYRISLVESQCAPDPAFPGVTAPNPEDESAMRLAVQLARRTGADIALGTDPDADRLGAAVPNEHGEFIMLSGNQIGCILAEYLLRQRKEKGELAPSDYIVRSFVSTRMAGEIASGFGVECIVVPTGFKFISNVVRRMTDRRFVLGFEESYGYLTGDFVADKDGVMALLLLLEVLCECRRNGETLYGRLRALYDRYGWHKEKVISASMDTPDGMQRVQDIMQRLRGDAPAVLGGQRTVAVTDYKSGIKKDANGARGIDFARTDALEFETKDGWLMIRPSGTEPKIKAYVGARAETDQAAGALLDALQRDAQALIG